jgi:FeS assembly SUF system protein
MRTHSAQDPSAIASDRCGHAARVEMGEATLDEMRGRIVEVLKTIYDPEIPVDIYALGLIYDIDVEEDGSVDIRMTLTTPMCPVAESLPREVEVKVRAVPGVSSLKLDLVWDPPWTPDRMSEAARLQLNL